MSKFQLCPQLTEDSIQKCKAPCKLPMVNHSTLALRLQSGNEQGRSFQWVMGANRRPMKTADAVNHSRTVISQAYIASKAAKKLSRTEPPPEDPFPQHGHGIRL